MLSFGLYVLPFVVAAGKSDGTCGYQCTSDSECGGCGVANSGKCSCPDGDGAKFPAISCTCVSAPTDAPKDPAADVTAAAWPDQWTANVDAWCYSDFTNKSTTAKGKFYYDATLGKTRADWSPYTNGKDATQVWIVDSKSSSYYVKSGPLCIYFPITDPGITGKPVVGIERPDWMKTCNDVGMAKYVGREQVEGEWVDHWACHLDYEAASQQITFQNWHTLGLGKMPKGAPLRVTGGNSAPNGQKGSPRLNSVWYKDFVIGSNATQADDFKKPSWLCIPVALDEAKAFFGHEVSSSHTFDPAFQRRAHYLPHAKANAQDLTRARRPKPGPAFRGDSFKSSMQKLNDVLRRDKNLRTQSCESFPLELLQEMQRELFNARSHELDAVYQKVADTRQMAHKSVDALHTEQARITSIEGSLLDKARDGACHEMVMWYIHHLSEGAREEIKQRLILPLLPEVQHSAPDSESAGKDDHDVHTRYQAQASCAVCHVDPKAALIV